MSKILEITRLDGRSNAQVILDLVKDHEPGRVFEYDEIITALEQGTDKHYTVRDVQGVISRLYSRMLKEQARALHAVPKVGYRLAPASFHTTLANNRKSRADKQMLRGMQTLQNVKWNEMNENERKAHEGQLLITSAIYSQMQALSRRQSKIEDLIASTFGKPVEPT